MLKEHQPIIGQWYRRPDRPQAFQVVACDMHARTVDIEYFDGTVDEWPLAHWTLLDVAVSEAPIDCSGAYDSTDGEDLDDSGIGGPARPWTEMLERMCSTLERSDWGPDIEMPDPALSPPALRRHATGGIDR